MHLVKKTENGVMSSVVISTKIITTLESLNKGHVWDNINSLDLSF